MVGRSGTSRIERSAGLVCDGRLARLDVNEDIDIVGSLIDGPAAPR